MLSDRQIVQGLMAFWEYSSFPYLCWGEIEYIRSDGMVYVSSYQGTFRPLLILPMKDGEALAMKIKKVVKDENEARKTHHIEFAGKLQNVLPDSLKKKVVK